MIARTTSAPLRSAAVDPAGRRRRVVLIAVAVCLSLVAASCGSSGAGITPDTAGDVADLGDTYVQPDPGPPQHGGRIEFGLEAETSGWDPTTAQWAGTSAAAVNAIFDHLTAFDENGDPKPYLAESIEPNQDASVWTIGLRQGVLFHDGTALDADAVKLNLDRQRASALLGPALALVASVDVVDPLTIDVTMSSPWATFPSVLAAQPGVVAAPTQLNSADPSRNPIGTGPFEFRDWTPDYRLLVTRNDHYWRTGLPYADEIEFRILTEPETRRAALDSGSLDGFQESDPASIKMMRDEAQAGNVQMFTDAQSDTAELLLGLNTAVPPFDDPEARQILATAIDTATLSSVVFSGIFPPATGPFEESSPSYVKTDYPAYDPAAAKQLADRYEQQHGAPLTFALEIGQDFAPLSVAELIQAQLGEAGVVMRIEGVEQAALVRRTLLGDYQAMYGRLFGATTFDRETVVLSGPSAKPVGQVSLNFTRMQDPELDAALEAARATTDPTVRQQQNAVVQQRLAVDLNYVFLCHSVTAAVYSNSLHGLDDPTLPDGTPMVSRGSPMMVDAWLSR